MLPSRIPAVSVGGGMGAAGTGGVGAGPAVSSSFAHSAYDPAHVSSGSASLSRETVIPSTDNFIEQLKQRLRHTEDLIHTARLTAKATDSFNHYSQ